MWSAVQHQQWTASSCQVCSCRRPHLHSRHVQRRAMSMSSLQGHALQTRLRWQLCGYVQKGLSIVKIPAMDATQVQAESKLNIQQLSVPAVVLSVSNVHECYSQPLTTSPNVRPKSSSQVSLSTLTDVSLLCQATCPHTLSCGEGRTACPPAQGGPSPEDSSELHCLTWQTETAQSQ